MATAISHGHGSPVGTVAAASGSSAAAALPAITVSGLPAGTGGTTCPLGRERSSLTSLGGPPRKETSYASSTASKISIATLPLDTLEHIIDDFRAHQHHGAKQHANGGNRGGRGGGPPAVRISTTVAAGGGGGRASVRTWNPVAGGGGGTAAAGPIRRSHGNVGSISFNFAAKPTTPQGNGPGGVLPGVLVQPPVLPGLPPGAPLSLSSRAAAVLQVPESAAHLQRFIALDAAQLENHYVIAHPNGAAVTDLQEVIDNASSIDGLPSGREAVVVLTTTADGVPIPRIVPLDQPLPGSLRRSGMGHTRGASATGVSMVDALLLDGAVRSSNSSASLLAAGQVLMVDIVPGYEGGGGGTEGDVVTPPNASTISFARAGSNPIFVPAPPLSPQRSMAALYSPRRGGTPPARRSDNGLPRGVPYPANVRVSSVTMMGPGQPSSPPLRSTAGVAMQGNNLQINTLPALGDGSAAAAGARRSAPRRRGSASALIRREASSDAVAQSLPVLVRTISPDRSNLAAALVTADGGFNSLDGGVESMGASPINSGPVHPGGGGAGVSTRPRSGAVDGHQDLSPTRSRLHARIVTLQTERSSHQLLQPTQAQRQTSPLQPRGGGRNGVGRSTITMSGLSGMELVRAALKQVETGERTLVDPLVRISSNGVSEGSRRASQSSVTTACSGHGSGVGGSSEAFQPGAGPIPVLDTAALAEEVAREEEEEREAAERRQARLVKSLTMLLTTGRSRGQVSRQSSAASRLSRNASLVLAQDANDADDEEDVGSADGSSTTGEDEDLQHRGGDGHSQQPSGDGSTSTSVQPPQPSRENSQQHLTASKSARGKHEHRRYNRFRSRLLAGSRQASEISLVGARSRSVRSSRGSDNGSDTLEAAAAIAADGGLDPQALVEFAQQLDQANEEFRLVEAARERARRLEALLTQAQIAANNPAAAKRRATGDGSAAGAGGPGRAVSPDKQPIDMYLLAKRREGNKPHNVTQVISALEAPLDRPMEVDLDQLLSSIGDALAADEQDVRATRFDETFRIRTERYLAQLCRMNPAAFEEVSAAQAEADYRSSVERAKLRLRQLHGEVAGEPLTSAGKPRSQYDKAVVMLQAHRPFFLPPVMQREVPERAPVPPMIGGRGSSRPPWDVYASIFRERKRGDARDVYDNDAVLAAQFHLDWSRTVTKMLFMKLVAREDLGVRGKSGRQALEQELTEVRSALAEHFGLIRSAFSYYSIATPEEVYTTALSAAVAAAANTGGSIEAAAAEIAANFTAAAAKRGPPPPSGTTTSTFGAATTGVGRTVSPATSNRDAAAAAAETPPSLAESEHAMTLAAATAAANTGGGATGEGHHMLEMDEQRWLAFCTSVGITGRAAGVRVSDMRALFWTVNREEEKNMTTESVANNDYAFMRFEFSEALVRAAFGRYITAGTVRDASDATRRLMQDLKMSLPPIARVDPNNFRRNRLYTAEMEVAVVHNLELLTASFKLYKARDRAKYLSVDHWMSFLETNNLMAHHMGGITPTEARLMFAWSQMVVVDELKLRRRAVSLQLWDFVEAVARLADRVALPTTEEMDKWMLYNLNIGRHTPLPPGHTRVWTYCNALAIGRGGPGLERRASGREILSAPTRPLAIKFRALMEYLAGSLAVAWGGNNTHETAQSMLRTANMLCGGVELA